jgi:hypothetical protein
MIGNTSTIGSKGAYASGNFASKKAINYNLFSMKFKNLFTQSALAQQSYLSITAGVIASRNGNNLVELE